MWQSVKGYVRAVCQWWWVVAMGFGFGIIGTILDIWQELAIPIWVWVAIGLGGLSIAQFLAFHKLREQQARPHENWIDAYKIQHGKLPSVPDWLPAFVPGLKVGETIMALPIPTPSGQMWARTPPSQQGMLQEYADWAKSQRPELRSWEDIIWHMKQMAPKTPPGVGRIKWKPPEQR